MCKNDDIPKLPKNGEWGSRRDVYHSSPPANPLPHQIFSFTLSFIAPFPIAHSFCQRTRSFSLSFLFQLRILKILVPDTSPQYTRPLAILSAPHLWDSTAPGKMRCWIGPAIALLSLLSSFVPVAVTQYVTTVTVSINDNPLCTPVSRVGVPGGSAGDVGGAGSASSPGAAGTNGGGADGSAGGSGSGDSNGPASVSSPATNGE